MEAIVNRGRDNVEGIMLFSLGQVGEGIMLFSLGQVLGLLCNPAESTRKAFPFPAGRPADAAEGNGVSFLARSGPRIALQSCGIYSKSIIHSLQGVLRTL